MNDSPTRRHFNPDRNPDIDNLKGLVDGLIKLVLDKTREGSPATKRAAALAVTNLEQGGMWAAKALSIQAEEAKAMTDDDNTITFEDVKASPTVETPLPGMGGYMDGIKEETEALIARIKERTKDLSPASQRAAAIAITHYETAMLWAVRARFL